MRRGMRQGLLARRLTCEICWQEEPQAVLKTVLFTLPGLVERGCARPRWPGGQGSFSGHKDEFGRGDPVACSRGMHEMNSKRTLPFRSGT